VLLSYYSRLPRVKKVILAVSAIPIAIFSNAARIVILSLVSEIYGAKVATGGFHNVMGVLVFVFAFLGLSITAKILKWKRWV
jgi:exosortase/archaeosortase family protein